MTEIALLKMAHVLGLVYWLGADLGVFYSSFVLCDDKQSGPVRVSAAKILFALDQAPRMCMTLMLPLGIHLASKMGFIQAPGRNLNRKPGLGCIELDDDVARFDPVAGLRCEFGNDAVSL